MFRSRPARRLLVAALVLAILDVIEPRVRQRLEVWRYEDLSKDFRFENSDLFGVGPLTSYLREHPRGRQPRVMFLGNSVTYGYGLSASEAVPGQYQRLDRSEKILNVGVNGFDAGSAYLVAKATSGAVDHVYVLNRPFTGVSALFANRVPVDAGDAQRFGLNPPTPLEQSLAKAAARWALYRDAYRLQAALFGTSSRIFLYLHKGAAIRGLVAAVRAAGEVSAQPGDEVEASVPLAESMPTEARLATLRGITPPMLWLFAELFRSGDAPLVILQVPGFAEWLPDRQSVADFNRAYFPRVRVVILDVPPGLFNDDRMHLTAGGAASTARALWRERQAHEATAR